MKLNGKQQIRKIIPRALFYFFNFHTLFSRKEKKNVMTDRVASVTNESNIFGD